MAVFYMAYRSLEERGSRPSVGKRHLVWKTQTEGYQSSEGSSSQFEGVRVPAGALTPEGITIPTSTKESTAMEAARQAVATGKVIKISANLPAASINDLRSIAERRGITLTEALRRSIGTTKFVMDVMDAGGKVLAEDASRHVRQIVLI